MRRRITYANVAATLALVFSMTGGALAANHYLINSTKQINPKVLKKLRGRTGATGKLGAAGPQGAAGKNGVNGERGPSNAFSLNSGNDIQAWPATPNERATVLSLSLPAGNFAITSTVLANNNSGTASVECELVAGGKTVDPGEGVALITLSAAAPGDRGYLSQTGTVSLSSPGKAEVICKSDSTSGNYLNRAITAIQVGAIG
jgi:hypothetical protein